MPDLRTIRGVELMKVGTWNTVSHPDGWTVTADGLRSIVAAHKARVLPPPRLKLGHTDPRFDGGPALGRVDNLRLADGGNTLVGDYVAAIAPLLPSGYPQRSVECWFDIEGQDGRVWPLVLTAVALLGDTMPGVSTLADLPALYDVAASGRRVVLVASAPLVGRPANHRARAVAVARARRTRSARFVSHERTPS
ncbi:hypothetical protein [Mycolicibacterium wolinskyi]|uniref:hypothetical protein n=1 Tax=Mycolicibacterium wolinskyi TaxID=59750 RepID=UPI003917AE33